LSTLSYAFRSWQLFSIITILHFLQRLAFFVFPLVITCNAFAADVLASAEIDGEPVTVNIVTSGDRARIGFEGVAGQLLGLAVAIPSTTDSTITLYKPDGTTLLANYDCDSQGQYAENIHRGCSRNLTLPTTGHYELLVVPDNNAALTFITTLSTNPAEGATLVENEIAPFSTPRSGQDLRMYFSGAVGDRLHLAFTGVNHVPGASASVVSGSSTVSILDPDGIALVTAFAMTNGNTFKDLPALTKAGTYSIYFDPYNAHRITAGNLRLSRTVTGEVSIDGDPLTSIIAYSGQNAHIGFEGVAGQQIGLAVAIPSTTDTYLTVYQPNGAVWLASFYCESQGQYAENIVRGCSRNLTLPASGHYVMVVSPNNDAPLTFITTLSTNPVEGATLVENELAPVSTTRSGQDLRMFFTGAIGDQLHLAFTGLNHVPGASTAVVGGSSTVSILDPDGIALVTAFAVANGNTFKDLPTLTKAGTYSIYFDPYYAHRISAGNLRLTRTVTGEVSIDGDSLTTVLPYSGQNARIGFEGVAGQLVGLAVAIPSTTDSTITIYQPNGTTLLANYACDSQGSYTADIYRGCSRNLTLPATGHYELLVVPDNNATLTFITTLSTNPAEGATLVENELAPVSTTRSGQDLRMYFTGAIGDRLHLAFTGVNHVPGASTTVVAGTSWVSILDPDGTPLVTGFAMANGNTFKDLPTLTKAGTYSIYFDPYYAHRISAGNLRLTRTVAGEVSIDGNPLASVIAYSGQNARIGFEGVAGQQVGLAVATTSTRDMTISIYQPNGTAWLANYDCDSQGQYTADIYRGCSRNLTLPATGHYELLVVPDSDGTMPFTTTISSDLFTLPGATSAGTDIPLVLRAGQNARPSFAGVAGSSFRLTVKSVAVSLTQGGAMHVYRPNGTLLASKTFANGGPTHLDIASLPETGTYSTWIETNYASSATMTVNMAANLVVPLTIDGASKMATFTVPGQTVQFSLNGTAGQSLGLGLSDFSLSEGGAPGAAAVVVLSPDNSVLSSSTCMTSNGGCRIELGNLPATGTYYIMVTAQGQATGALKATLSSEFLATLGTAQLPVNLRNGQAARLTLAGTLGEQRLIRVLSPVITGAGGDGSVSVLKPDGSQLAAFAFSNGNDALLSLPVFPESGNYTLVITAPYAAAASFGVLPAIDTIAPTISSLNAGQVLSSTRLWAEVLAEDSEAGLDHYDLQIASDEAFANLAWSGTATSNLLQSSALDSGQYYVRARAVDRAGNASAFTILPGTVTIEAAPVASFTSSTQNGEAPLSVTFTSTATGSMSSLQWDFGDGQTSTQSEVTHKYAEAGNYSVTLTAAGVGGVHISEPTVITVTPDVTAPSFDQLSLDGVAVGASILVAQEAVFSLQASDADAVYTFKCRIDDAALTLLTGNNGVWSVPVDPLAMTDGDHLLYCEASDRKGNLSTLTRTFTVQLAPPAVPVMAAPAVNQKFNVATVLVTGSAERGSEIVADVNGILAPASVLVNADGPFTLQVAVPDGQVALRIAARNRGGQSAWTASRNIQVDTTIPRAPTNLSARTAPLGKVTLAWTVSSDPAVKGYHVYRASSTFTQIAQAVRVNNALIAGNTFDDLPSQDGKYYYAVVGVNDYGTLTPLSQLVQAVADNVEPRAISIVYTPQGKVDATTGTVGQGLVAVTLNVSEALQTTPYLAIVPNGGTPVPLELTKSGDTRYEGSFLVTPETGSGQAHALFSARDSVGNRGTVIDVGTTLQIDTEGPALTGISIAPNTPIRNDNGQSVTATFTLSGAVKSGSSPVFGWTLSGPGNTPQEISNVTAVDATTWSGTLTLPLAAGATGSETLAFAYAGTDDLDNASTRITAPNAFQVYQGDLPPLNSPLNFAAQAQAGGKVGMSWQAEAGAAGYQLYRKAPGDADFVALVRVTTVTHIDQTPMDGAYRYAVATVRQSNGQESLSAMSESVEVVASATAPGAPQNLQLALSGRGIALNWQPPLSSTVAGYRVYRATGMEILSVDGLTPLRSVTGAQLIDATPSLNEHAYVVTAVDAAGNESALSNSAYLNASLLPVASLRVERQNRGLPVLTWTASPTAVAGYHVYVGDEPNRVRLTTGLVSALSFTDSTYTQGARVYAVAAVDSNGVEIARDIQLPDVSLELVSGLPVQRSVMNRLMVQVSNNTATATGEGQVKVNVGGRTHVSAPTVLSAHETRLVPVVVGGYGDLPASAPATLAFELLPHENERVSVVSTRNFDVIDGALVLGIATEDLIRGGTGKVRLTVDNTSDVDVELLTARYGGNTPSDELRFKLLDKDGNVLAMQPYRQVLGNGVVNLSNGLTVARIPAATRFASELFTLLVPGSTPTQARLRLEVDKLRYRSGELDEVIIDGRGTETAISLIETAYTAEVTEVTPLNSYGDTDVVISGRALRRDTQMVLPYAPVKLLLSQEGFERSVDLITDASGNFSYAFAPGYADAGVFTTAAVHPDLTDKPVQKTFTIQRVTAGPGLFKLTVPRNYSYAVPFQVSAGLSSTATNVRLVLDETSQAKPAGISLGLPAPVSVAPRQTLNIPVEFTADNTVPATGTLRFKVYSDEHPTNPMGLLTLEYTLGEAKPYLTAMPSFVETGLAMGASQMESVVLTNKGLQDALNLRFALTLADGSPAPAWVSLATNGNGTLKVGETRSLDLAFMPPASLAAGVYEFRLKVQGDNITDQNLNVFAMVTASGEGNALFKAADIYTATVDQNGNLIPGLAGARITVQNEDVAAISQTLPTDAQGEAYFQNLPTGFYKFKAVASSHQEVNGRFQVKPGITTTRPVFLEYNVIQVEWSVREISIEDRYEIILNATFETDVPTAVVLVEPLITNLPTMNPGQVYFGELTLTNYGLVRADNVKATLPSSDAYFRYEFLAEVPDTLMAKSRVVIPYRIVSLVSLENSGTASGGGCYSYTSTARVNYQSQCANGDTTTGSTQTHWSRGSSTTCFTGGGGSAGGGSVGGGNIGGGSIGGGLGGGGGISYSELPGQQICQECPDGTCDGGGGSGK
jgi:PKD repeat protein